MVSVRVRLRARIRYAEPPKIRYNRGGLELDHRVARFQRRREGERGVEQKRGKEETEEMPATATMVGDLLGLGTQMYSNAHYVRRTSSSSSSPPTLVLLLLSIGIFFRLIIAGEIGLFLL